MKRCWWFRMGVICVWESEWLVKEYICHPKAVCILWYLSLARLELLMWRQPLPTHQKRAGTWYLDFRAPRSSGGRRWGLSFWPVYLIFSSVSPPIHRSLILSLAAPPGLPTTYNCSQSFGLKGTTFAAWKQEVSMRKTDVTERKAVGTPHPRAVFPWPQQCWHLEPDNSPGGLSCAL